VIVIVTLVLRQLVVAFFCAGFCVPAFAAENYQTDIGPTPKNGRQGANVQGRGTVLATLDNNKFSLQGKFSGLSSPATEAHLSMGNVMGGTGPAIGDLKIAQAQSGDISGTFMLTPDQVAALQSRHGRDAAGHAIEQAMADIAEGLVRSGVRRLVIAGGETSGAVVDRLGIPGFLVGAEIAAGVPVLRAVGAKEGEMLLALKSGNFGGPRFFSDALDLMR